MIPFSKCPACGGEMVQKESEKLLRGGRNSAVLRVSADVCLHCGERLYPLETVKKFDEIRGKLEREETVDFEPLGRLYKAA